MHPPAGASLPGRPVSGTHRHRPRLGTVRRWLRESIDSIWSQRDDLHFRLLVIDNASDEPLPALPDGVEVQRLARLPLVRIQHARLTMAIVGGAYERRVAAVLGTARGVGAAPD